MSPLAAEDKYSSNHIETMAPSGANHTIDVGTARLEVNGVRVLVPTPSDDPNDPLNWPKWRKCCIVAVLCFGVVMSNWMAAGVTAAVVQLAMQFTHPINFDKTTYLFTCSALFQGVGTAIWIPVINKFGRRTALLASTLIFLLSIVWCGLSDGFASELCARIALGFSSGGAECLGAIVIADLFFVHERGTYMIMFTVFLGFGAGIGIIINGLIIQNLHNWRWMYWIGAIAVGALFFMVFLFVEETAYIRVLEPTQETVNPVATDDKGNGEVDDRVPPSERTLLKRKSYVARLKIYNGTFTSETMLKMMGRSVIMALFPPVLFATLIWSVNIGFLVALTSCYSQALQSPPYLFTPLQAGLIWIAGIVGGFVGVPLGGYLSTKVPLYLTHRNGGLYEPEMRLPCLWPGLITGPLGLCLFGATFEYHLHWMVAAVGIGIWQMHMVIGTNIAMTYAVDVYKPVASEVVVAILGWKGAIGFGLAFSTTPWIASQGYLNCFGEMSAITVFVYLFSIVLYFYGKPLRHVCDKWSMTRMIMWDADRE